MFPEPDPGTLIGSASDGLSTDGIGIHPNVTTGLIYLNNPLGPENTTLAANQAYWLVMKGVTLQDTQTILVPACEGAGCTVTGADTSELMTSSDNGTTWSTNSTHLAMLRISWHQEDVVINCG